MVGGVAIHTDRPKRSPEFPALAPAPGREKVRWFREPLVHFLVLGALLFVAHGVLNRRSATGPASQRIELTADDLVQLQIGFASKWRRPPTPQEMSGLVEDRVREEVLYREALALGLDRDDTIVKRRMGQKMEFLAQDVSGAREPDGAQLKAWFDKNASRFAEQGRLTFRHLYFSPDRRGARARSEAAQALGSLDGQPISWTGAASLADPFMFQSYLADRTTDQVAKEFGLTFAETLFTRKPGAWTGPIESGYGWHLVFVEASTPGRVPAFEEVESDVKAAWMDEQRADSWRSAYGEMRAKYVVVLPAAPAVPVKASP